MLPTGLAFEYVSLGAKVFQNNLRAHFIQFIEVEKLTFISNIFSAELINTSS